MDDVAGHNATSSRSEQASRVLDVITGRSKVATGSDRMCGPKVGCRGCRVVGLRHFERKSWQGVFRVTHQDLDNAGQM
jgi:hypothetical protein